MCYRNVLTFSTGIGEIPVLCNSTLSLIYEIRNIILFCNIFDILIWSLCCNQNISSYTLSFQRFYTFFQIRTFFVCTNCKSMLIHFYFSFLCKLNTNIVTRHIATVKVDSFLKIALHQIHFFYLAAPALYTSTVSSPKNVSSS